MSVKSFDVIAAADKNLGIGLGGKLPWDLPGELAYFRRRTSQAQNPGLRCAVIMGRKTWESLPEGCSPLPGRLNVVLSRSCAPNVQARVARSFEEALSAAGEPDIERLFVIGGASVYKLAFEHPACNLLYLTQIESIFKCDAFIPEYEQLFDLVSESKLQEERGVSYRFLICRRKPPPVHG